MDSKTETRNIQYESDIGNDTDDGFTSDSDTEDDIGEDSDAEDYAGLARTVNEKKFDIKLSSEDDMVHRKLCHLQEEYAQKLRILFDEYQDVIANSLEDVRL